MVLKPFTPSSGIDLSTNGSVFASRETVDLLKARKIARVFLLYPPTGVYMRDDRCQAPVEGMTAQPNRAPLDLAYMAAMLEQIQIKCQIRDYAAAKSSWELLQS